LAKNGVSLFLNVCLLWAMLNGAEIQSI